ncbi:MAG: hypothetical protein QXW80_00370 [Candidatus Micrarchaeia archaeon]
MRLSKKNSERNRMFITKELYQYALELRLTKKQRSKNYDPWNEETTVFKSGNKTLVFVGTVHHPTKKDISVLKEIIETTKPELLLIERAANTPYEKIVSMIQKPSDEWSDMQWATCFAKENSIPIKGMDIIDRFKPFTIAGPFWDSKEEGIKAGLLFLAIAYMQNPKRYVVKELTNEDRFDLAIFDIIQEFMLDSGRFNRYKHYLLSALKRDSSKPFFISLKSCLEKVGAKYISDQSLSGLLKNYVDISQPYPFSTKYKINKIWAWWDAHRNRTMIESCINALKESDSVVAVAGWGHIFVLRDILRKEIEKNFGKTKMSRWKEYKNQER